jgi:glycerol-3-phosphate dehydrogenase
MYQAKLPDRVRVLVLGGGIHGVGVLHDMASRGWQDIHLVEKSTLAAGTSSRSTKLIHGGLRYLKNIKDFGMVMEALKERKLLMELAPDLNKPVELLFPILKEGGLPKIAIKAGLTMYDRLAGKYGLEPHRYIEPEEVEEICPVIDSSKFSAMYSFFDGQTDDYALVHRVAHSSVKLGAKISENSKVVGITDTGDGWDVQVENEDGEIKTISALYIVNCLGPWANMILEKSKIPPTHFAINNKGIHLILNDIGIKTGMFLESPKDQRIFFVLPWKGYTLVGTTEELFSGDPDALKVESSEVDYLLERMNFYLKTPIKRSQILKVFSGLRWLISSPGGNLTSTSRSHEIGEIESRRGMMLTIYGGKLTTYRSLSKKIGDRITSHFGEFKASTTHEHDSWVGVDEAVALKADVLSRFEPFPKS